MGSWADHSRARIAAVHASLPEGVSLKERVAAVDDAYPFGQRAHFPYKAWLKERRAYLCRHGYQPRASSIKSPQREMFDALPRDPVTGRPLQ